MTESFYWFGVCFVAASVMTAGSYARRMSRETIEALIFGVFLFAVSAALVFYALMQIGVDDAYH